MMPSFKFLLTTAVLAVATVPSVQAQAVAYTKYSVVITANVPKASAAETVAKNKKTAVPTNTKYTPCLTGDVGKDQLSFNIKYDAGDATDNLRNFYVVLKSPSNQLYSVVREIDAGLPKLNFLESKLTGKIYTDLSDAKAYTHRDNNLGGVQTEVFLGGNVSLDGLEPGLWSITGIVAKNNNTALPMMKPGDWAAWDTATFVLGSPWPIAGYCTIYSISTP